MVVGQDLSQAPRVLVTGASGFVGRRVCAELGRLGYRVTAVSRTAGISIPGASELAVISEIGPDTRWDGLLEGQQAVIHLAARVHVMNEKESDPLAAFARVNTHGTERLARQAADAGVGRLVYLSSIKVNGEGTDGRAPFSEKDTPSPADAYAISKWRAEEILGRVSKETGLEAVVIRPPLVYGPGVKANFLRLIRWVDRGIPLPFGKVANKRSLVGLDNLVDLIVTCTSHPAAANQTLIAGDGEDLSTPEILGRMGVALGKQARLFSIPPWIFATGTRLARKRAVAERLLGSLQVDITKARTLLGWTPPYSVDDELARTVKWYLASRRKN